MMWLSDFESFFFFLLLNEKNFDENYLFWKSKVCIQNEYS